MKKILNLFLLAILLVSVISCSKEETLQEKEEIKVAKLEVAIKNAQNLLIDKKYNSTRSTSSSSIFYKEYINVPFINWDKAFINYDSADKINLIVPSTINYLTGEFIQFVYSSNNEKSNGAFIRFIPDSSYFANSKHAGELENFTGIVKIYNLKGGIIKTQKFINGIAIEEKIIKSYSTSSDCTDCTLQTVTVSSTKTISYGNKIYTIIIIDFSENNIQNESLMPSSEGGSGDQSNYKIELKKNIKNPCLTNIIDVLLKNNLEIELTRKLLDPFVSTNGININIVEISNPDPSLLGWSKALSLNNFEIQINTNFFESKSKDYIASAIVHEFAHVFLKYSIQQGNISPQSDTHKTLLDNYMSTMYQMIKNYNYNLSDETINSMILTGMAAFLNAPSDINSEELKDYFNEVILKNNFSLDSTSPNYYQNLTLDHIRGTFGNICN